MNVCGSRIATRGPPGRIGPSVIRPPNRCFGPRQLPAAAERVGDLEADVVPGPGVAVARDCRGRRSGSRPSRIRRRARRARAPTATAAEPAHRGLALGAGVALVAGLFTGGGCLLALALALADELGLLLDLGLLLLDTRGG